jgi:hypothetical protein
MNLAYRVGRNSPLSYEELDGNFQQLEAGVNASEKLPLIVPIADFGLLLGGPEGYPLGRFKLPDANAGYYIGVVVERLYLSSNFYIRSTLPSGLVVVHAWVDDALEDITVYSTVRANHTGTQDFSTITGTVGMLSMNPFVLSSGEDLDQLLTPGTYLYAPVAANGYLVGAYIRVLREYTADSTFYTQDIRTFAGLDGTRNRVMSSSPQLDTGWSDVINHPSEHTHSPSEVGLEGVTQGAQTLASVVPNTSPGFGQLLVGDGGSYIPRTIVGDVSITREGVTKLEKISTRTPASASATGSAGNICWDSGYFYVCVAANTWKRAALSSW